MPIIRRATYGRPPSSPCGIFLSPALPQDRQRLDVVPVRDLAAQLFIDKLELEAFCRTDSAFRRQCAAEHDRAVVKGALAAVVALDQFKGHAHGGNFSLLIQLAFAPDDGMGAK